MNRTQSILLGLLILQVVLILVVRAPFGGAQADAGLRPYLPGLEAISPSRLELEGAGAERLTLIREGEGWTVDGTGGFPADADKVRGLIEDLESLRVRRPVVTSSRYHGALRVGEDDHEARLRLWAGDADEPEIDLILGSSPNYRTTHARLAGEDPVYEVRGISPYDLRPDRSSWILHDLVEVERDLLTGFTLVNANGTIDLERADGTWSLRGADGADASAIDPVKLDDLLRAATSLRFADAAGPTDATAEGLASPAATLTLRWSEPDGAGAAERELTVLVGGVVEGDDAKRYATRAGFEFSGTVWDSSVGKLIEQDLEGLLADPE